VGPADSDDVQWSWGDQEGTVHFTSWREIPQRFRPRAERVTASVGVTTGARYTGSYRPESAAPASQPTRDIHEGPRLNGLTDGEREELERARAASEERRRQQEADQWKQTHDRDVQAAWDAQINRTLQGYERPRPRVRR
jgi:hypothetical protein